LRILKLLVEPSPSAVHLVLPPPLLLVDFAFEILFRVSKSFSDTFNVR
jgi:hypothetical protein